MIFRHWWMRLVLRAAVHRDGFCRSPAGYAQAVIWRLAGRKLRARNRFSELTGQSPHAYRLWMAETEPAVMAACAAIMPRSRQAMLVVIEPGQDEAGLAATRASVLASDPDARISTRPPADFDGWILALRAGDLIAPQGLPAYGDALSRHENSTIIYADDDLLDNRGRRHTPHFKPDWNPELFAHHDYLSHSALIRCSGPMAGGPGWIDNIVQAALDAAVVPPVHLPCVLHHRQSRPEPIIPSYMPSGDDADCPHVTVIIPTRDRVELLSACIDGLRKTDYPCFDCIVIDNDSVEPGTRQFLQGLPLGDFTVLPFPGAFNYSAMNNAAARVAKGDFLCFLNNDIEMIEPTWLRAMVAQAQRADCGAVGAKLLYPDGTIQHAGVVTGVGGGAAHAHRLLAPGTPGYFHRADLPQRISAVTAACMVVAKSKFLEVDGFDADSFPVAFNDVDLCLKLNARGWQAFYEPRAVLVHHESKSRGDDRASANRVRFASELAALKRIWRTDLHVDPYHHPQLSRFSTTFVVST